MKEADMQELEDDPEDVQKASPVEDEVQDGENDEISSKKTEISSESKDVTDKPHSCQKDKPPIPKIDCCEAKRLKKAKQNKMVTMYVHEEPCKLAKQEILPRHCMSKDEYLDFLAAPRKKCESSCNKKPVQRRLRTLSPRIEELAKPTKRRLYFTLEERASMLSPEVLNNLIEILEGETALTPEQAEILVRDKVLQSKAKHARRRSRSKCRSHKVKQMLGAGDESMNTEAVKSQYAMAIRFVRSIFSWQCLTPRTDYADISQVILEKMSVQLEYNPVGNEDRKSQQMRLLADVFACWISQILMDVAERRREELEAECLQRRREAEELALREEFEMQEEEVQSIAGQDGEEEEEEDAELAAELDAEAKCMEAVASLAKSMSARTQTSSTDLAASSSHTQYEDEDVDQEMSAAELEAAALAEYQRSLQDASSKSTHGGTGADPSSADEASTAGTESADASAQTEDDSADAGTEICPDISEILAQQSVMTQRLEEMASQMCVALDTQVPFLTFAKIFDTLFTMIVCHEENDLKDPLDNRIHRAIYEKFEDVMMKQEPELLDERMRDVVDVTTGKIAKWVRRTLDSQQIKFLDQNPAQIESREVRDWSKWLINVADMAEDWSAWINKVTCEVGQMKETGRMKRGEWQDWTSKFEQNALLWRRTHLEAVHQEHHNTMMLTDRQVTKTGCKRKDLPTESSEHTIKKTSFDNSSKATVSKH